MIQIFYTKNKKIEKQIILMKRMKKMSDNIKSVNPITSQLILRNLGMYCSSYLANDIYFLLESINLMISDIGEEFVEKRYKQEGKDWKKVKVKLEELNKLVIRTKTFYDPIIDKKFDKKEINENKTQSMFKKYFVKTGSKIALLQRDMYDIFIFLVKSTTIQRMTIPSEAFKVLEHSGFRKMDLTKKPGTTSPFSEEIKS